MDCHGAGGDWSFNSLIPDLLDRRCEFVVQHGGPSTPSSSSRAATPRCSSASTRWRAPSAACSPHRVRSTNWHKLSLQRRRGRRGRHQRRAVRHLGLPGRARHRRRRRLRARRPSCSAPGLHDASRSRPGSAASAPATSPPLRGPRADRGRGRARRWPTPGAPAYDPGAPCTITVELDTSEQVERYRHHAVVEIVDGAHAGVTRGRLVDGLAAVLLHVLPRHRLNRDAEPLQQAVAPLPSPASSRSLTSSPCRSVSAGSRSAQATVRQRHGAGAGPHGPETPLRSAGSRTCPGTPPAAAGCW